MKNKLRIFGHMFVANAKQFIRDKPTLFWILAFPILFTLIFGIVFSGGTNPTYNIGLVIGGNNQVTKGVKEGLTRVPVFKLTTGSYNDELQALRNGKRSLIIDLRGAKPTEIATGESIDVEILYNKDQSGTSQALIASVREVLSTIERKMTSAPKIFSVTSSAVQSEQLSQFDYLLPGILAMAIMQLGLFGVFQFLSLRDQQVIRGLAVTPLPRVTIFQSEVLLRLIVAVFQALLIVAVGWGFFNVTISGSPLLILGLVLLGALTFVSMGYMVASFASSLESGQMIIQVIQFPMMFLSGIFFPLEIMPSYIRPVVRAIPLTYLGDALRQSMVNVPSDYSLVLDVSVLAGWLAVSSFLAIRYWRWE